MARYAGCENRRRHRSGADGALRDRVLGKAYAKGEKPPLPDARMGAALVSRSRADGAADQRGARRLPYQQFSRARRAYHRDARLGAGASRRPHGRSRRDLPAGLARPLALYVPYVHPRRAEKQIRGAHRADCRPGGAALLGSVRHLQAGGDASRRELLFRDPRLQRSAHGRHGCAIAAHAVAARIGDGAGGMNNSLERLIAGIIATLRTDVIPNVSDAYARGQAIGVIDVLNTIAPRLEWAGGSGPPAAQAVRALGPQAPAGTAGLSDQALAAASSAALAAERDRLDGEISDLIAWAQSADARGDVAAATALLRQHVHDELTREMKMTKKPLFAEISKATAGGQAKIQDKSQN